MVVMIYSENRSKQLSDELFLNPTVSYRGIPFWSWNCKVTKEQIDEQLDYFLQMGFGGVDIHPRTGLDIEYLGTEYMELIQYTVEQCKQKGLLCWLYDDDRFPSGCADGIVTKDWRMRERYLLLTTRYLEKDSFLLPDFCLDRQEFEHELDQKKEPKGYFAGAYLIIWVNGTIKSYQYLNSVEKTREAIANGEQLRFAYVTLLEGENWFEGQTYVDVLNPKAIQSFIHVTHEAYQKKVGNEFGKTVQAIFTDEPRLAPRIKLSQRIEKAESDQDAIIPYSESFDDKFKKHYGISALEIAPEYVWECTDQDVEHRYQYRRVLCDCFQEAFFDQIGSWCRANNILMTGHVMGEESLLSQTHYLGECMRCYENMELPGVDILLDERQLLTVKQAVSVARQYGREGVVSELYGVTNWDCSFKTYKLQGDWQAALGITVRVPHLAWMSMKGEAKRDWPASIFFQSPWYLKFSDLETYFARLNTALTRGKAVVRIAVLHPIESFWVHYGPVDQTGAYCEEKKRWLEKLAEELLYHTIDFDFLSEELLLKLQEIESESLSHYQTILIPPMTTIRNTTLEFLIKCRRKGVRLIFIGEIPSLVEARKDGRVKRLAEECICISESFPTLLGLLDQDRDVKILKTNGDSSDNLFYQLRKDGKNFWLFCSHVNCKPAEDGQPEQYQIWVHGEFTASHYDAQSGTISSQLVNAYKNREETWTCINWTAWAQDSLLLQLKPENTEGKGLQNGSKKTKKQYQLVQKLEQVTRFVRQEKNMLLLDFAEYQLDDGPIQKKNEILRLDNEIREKLGFELRNGVMKQPWAMQEKETHQVTLWYEFFSKIEIEAWLGLEELNASRIFLNGREIEKEDCGYYVDPAIRVISLQKLCKGKNILRIEVSYHQKTNLENLYLLGNFDVQVGEKTSTIREMASKLQLGDITKQGMPFYTGNLEYHFEIQIEEDGEYAVRVPKFSSPVLEMFVDGNEKGILAYEPHRQTLGYLKKGIHDICIELYGNRYNGFGMLHNANDAYVWLGPDSYRTTGSDWTDSYQLHSVGVFEAVELEQKVEKQVF